MARYWREHAGYAWPDVDISESDSEYIFSVEIPGTVKDDIKIWIEDNVLTVTGEKKAKAQEKDQLVFSERAFGKFERMFKLTKSVDRNKVSAELVDGILVIIVPKSIEARPREISIK